jgi:hypothetical protein
MNDRDGIGVEVGTNVAVALGPCHEHLKDIIEPRDILRSRSDATEVVRFDVEATIAKCGGDLGVSTRVSVGVAHSTPKRGEEHGAKSARILLHGSGGKGAICKVLGCCLDSAVENLVVAIGTLEMRSAKAQEVSRLWGGLAKWALVHQLQGNTRRQHETLDQVELPDGNGGGAGRTSRVLDDG